MRPWVHAAACGKIPREQQQDEYVRKMEINPTKYYPSDVRHDLVLAMPTIKMILEGKVNEKIRPVKAKFMKSDD